MTTATGIRQSGVCNALSSTIRVQIGLSMSRPMFQFIIFVQPFVLSTIAALVYQRAGVQATVNYVVLGAGFTTLWSSVVFSSASDIHRERYYGTLETIFTSPTSFAWILIGKIMGNTLLGLLSMVFSVTYVVTVWHVRVPLPHPWLLGAAVPLVFLTLSLFAFFLAIAFTLSRQAETLMNFAEYPVYVLCGFLFPVSALPGWLHPLSYALPPTWTVTLLRAVMDPLSTVHTIGRAFTGLMTVETVYLVLAVYCYRTMDVKARKMGKLGVY